ALFEIACICADEAAREVWRYRPCKWPDSRASSRKYLGSRLDECLSADGPRKCRSRLRPYGHSETPQNDTDRDGEDGRAVLYIHRFRAIAPDLLGSFDVCEAPGS